MQRNWIGKSQGAKVKFAVADLAGAEPIEVFNTRIDTIYGATAVILAPGHPLLPKLLKDSPARGEAEAKLGKMLQTSIKTEDLATMEKEGFFTGRYALNPFSGEKVPIWVGNFVLMEYGTGAIMAVPAHDERDLEFCRKYKLPVRVVIQPLEGEELVPEKMEKPFDEHNGKLVNSGPFNGLSPDEASAKCPKCGGAARRETDTMDTFVDSSWYFYRYCDPHNDKAPYDSAKVAYWFPIDRYIGGITHAILHLLYSRFWCKVMRDLGLIK